MKRLARARNRRPALLFGTCPGDVQDGFRKRRQALGAGFQVSKFSCSELRLLVGNFQQSFFPDVFVYHVFLWLLPLGICGYTLHKTSDIASRIRNAQCF
jgi:hypothetical protein